MLEDFRKDNSSSSQAVSLPFIDFVLQNALRMSVNNANMCKVVEMWH